MKLVRLRTIKIAVLLLIPTLFVSRSQSQIRWQIPETQRPALEARLKLFTQAQAEGRWDTVSSMLGRDRKNTGEYAQAHRECLISQLQFLPMISFETKDRQFTTASRPFHQRWWSLEGEVLWRTMSGNQKSPMIMDVYLDNGEWYFSPPNLDTYWLRKHLTDADLSADYSDDIEVASAPTSPLEIVDVHATLNKENLTDREVTFKLRNRSSKTVRNFGWRSNYESYATGCETGCNILPGSSFEQKISSPRYDYYVCAGVKKEKLLVDLVFFNDGSSWEPKAHSFAKKDTGTR